MTECEECGGNGRCPWCDGQGELATGEICGDCEGSGECNVCNGTGQVEKPAEGTYRLSVQEQTAIVDDVVGRLDPGRAEKMLVMFGHLKHTPMADTTELELRNALGTAISLIDRFVLQDGSFNESQRAVMAVEVREAVNRERLKRQ